MDIFEDFETTGHPTFILGDKEDDADYVVSDWYANHISGEEVEFVDSNGSEHAILDKSNYPNLTIKFYVYDREYSNGLKWEEKEFILHGELVEKAGEMGGSYGTFVIHKILHEGEVIFEKDLKG